MNAPPRCTPGHQLLPPLPAQAFPLPRCPFTRSPLCAVLLSSRYQLLAEPAALAIEFSLSYSGQFDHPVNTQEVPAFFVDRRLTVLALYTGDKPWTGDELTLVMPGGTNEVRLRQTDTWARA